MFNKFKTSILLFVLMFVVGCAATYTTTNEEGEEINLPKTLGYSVKALNTSKGFYGTIMEATNEAEKKGVVSYDQVEEVLVIANKYRAAQNIAQKGVDTWYNVVVSGEGEVDKNYVVVEVLRFVSMVPSMVVDINALLGTDLKVPTYLEIGNLIDVVDKDDSIDMNSIDHIIKDKTIESTT